MARKILLLTFCLFLGGLVSSAAQETPLRPLKSIESFKKAERVLVLVPHPDDEAIACAGVIQSALSAGSKLKIVYLTNGDHNQLSFIVYEKRLTVRKGEFVHMGEVRKKEALAAMNFLGVNKNDLVFLGYPDFGTFNMFSEYWASKKPYKEK